MFIVFIEVSLIRNETRKYILSFGLGFSSMANILRVINVYFGPFVIVPHCITNVILQSQYIL